MALCLHLLRLRLKPDELKAMNNQMNEPSETHTTQGWTTFLRELTPLSVLDGLGDEPKEKVARRQKAMEDMYAVAQKEEEYLSGACDGDATIQWEPIDEGFLARRSPVGKRSRGVSVSSDGQCAGGQSRPKRVKKDNEGAKSVQNALLVAKMSNIDLGEVVRRDVQESSGQAGEGSDTAIRANTMPGTINIETADHKPIMRDAGHRIKGRRSIQNSALGATPEAFVQHSVTEYVPRTYTSDGLGSIQSSSEGVWDAYRAQHPPNTFPGRSDFMFQPLGLDAPGQHPLQVLSVSDIPQPKFDTVPNTPIFSQTGMRCIQPQGKYGQDVSQDAYGPVGLPAGMPVQKYQMPAAVEHMQSLGGQYYPEGFMTNQPQQTGFAFPATEHPQPSFHRLPTAYHPPQRPPQDQGFPYGYPELRLDQNIPAAPLPGSVIRGFTGHGNGVGGGAWV